jgi:hypothetical protein
MPEFRDEQGGFYNLEEFGAEQNNAEEDRHPEE